MNILIGKTSLCQYVTVVKGQFRDIDIENIYLQCDENPFTGAREEFKAVLLDSGNFEIFIEMYTPGTYNLFINNNIVSQIFLCPGQNLTISFDSGKLNYKGTTDDFQIWNRSLSKILNQYSFEHKFAISDSIINHLFEQKIANEALINKMATDFKFDPCEFEYCKYRNEYAIYTFIWADLLQKGYSIENEIFNFMEKLPLDDKDAAKLSLDYNRAVSVYIYLNLRLEKGWYQSNSFDHRSEEFNTAFYNKILTEIQDKDVRNITLTRKVISSLCSGASFAESLTKNYFTDCTNSHYKGIVYEYYNDFIKQKNMTTENPEIKKISGILLDELIEYKGQAIYLDFWASWCSPCRAGIPFTKELQKKYKDQAFQVVYINIDDNYGSFETAAKKLGLNKNLIYLNKEQSTEIRKQFNIQGIPHFVLIDKNGDIITTDAPEPNSFAIEKTLDELFTE